ncbi:MAG: acyltransferase [Acutalibacter sp.]|jgi:surface polysaccharide O-acyltransferase-like enzyme
MPQKEQPARDVAVDLVKTFAIVGVLLIHATTGATSANPVGSGGWYIALLWGSVSRASVPLFLMCTGALFLRPEKVISGKKLWLHYILHIAVALFFWAAVYKLYHLAAGHILSPGTLVSSCKELLAFQHEDHLYYLHMVLLIYALMPLLKLLTQYGSKRLLEYLLGVWFVLGVALPTVKGFWPFTLLSGVPYQWMMNLAYGSIGYVVLGYYLRKWPLPRWAGWLLGIVGCGAVFGLTAGFSLNSGALDTRFWEGMSVDVCLMGAGIFSLFSSKKATGPKLTAAAGFLSRASFCVYLCHILFLTLLQNRGLTGNWPNSLVGVPLLAAATLGCSLVVYLILSRIPVVRRWLI